MLCFFVFLLFMVGFRILKPAKSLYAFNSETTLPLRGLLALFIIMHHMSQRYDFSTDSLPSILNAASWGGGKLLTLNMFRSMGKPVVGVFFFLTGYGLAKSLMIKGERYLNGFLPKRLGSTLPEFIFLTILCSVYMIISGHDSPVSILENLQAGRPPLPNSWFIFTIVYVYLAFYMSAIMGQCRLKFTGIAFAVAIAIYCFITCWIFGFGKWWYISTPAVLMGYYIACDEDRITGYLKTPKSLLFSTIAMIFTISLFLAACYTIKVFLPYKFLPFLYAEILLTYIVVRLYGMGKSDFMVWLGGLSLNIYLVHGIYIATIKSDSMNPYLLLVIIIGISIITAWILKALRGLMAKR